MKIESKIILSNIVNIGLILLIGFFAMRNLNQMQTKLRFVEIADDLNATLLEMRLIEKNYFIYQKRDFLFDIQEKIGKAEQSLNSAARTLSLVLERATLNCLSRIWNIIPILCMKCASVSHIDTALESRLSAEGKMLREFSDNITSLERKG